MEILHFEDLGDTSVISECSLGVKSIVIDNFCLCSFGFFTSVYNLKAIGPLLMEILQFEDLGDTSVVSECSLVVNLHVVLDNFVLCSFWYFTSVYNLKAIGLLVMEILHF